MKQTYTVVDDFPSPDPEYPAAGGWRVQRFREEGAGRVFSLFYWRADGGKAEKPLPEEYAEAAGALRLDLRFDDVMFDLRDQVSDGPNVFTF